MLCDDNRRLVLFQLVLLVTLCGCNPVLIGTPSSTSTSSSISISAGPLFNVTRVFNSGDVFSNADPRCEPKNCLVLGGMVVRSSPCHCQCPNRTPVFLQHIRQCANSIEECRMLEFNQSGERQRIPTLFLPLTGQDIGPASPIHWEGAGIQIQPNGSVPCSVTGGGYLTQNGWAQLDGDAIFSLVPSNGQPFLQWLGSKQDQVMLTGKVVQVTIRCHTASVSDYCIVFRVIGKDVTPLLMDNTGSNLQLDASVGGSTSSTERANQLGLIVGIVCGALLAVTLVSVAVFWTVCWKQQKERLARKIQLHVLYQQQRMQQQAASGAFPHLANVTHSMNEPAVASTIEMLQNYGGVAYAQYLESAHQQQAWLERQQNDEMSRHYMIDQRGQLMPPTSTNNGSMDHRSSSDQLVLPPPPPYPHARRKLYFSPEFFDPDLMADPPPVAEEFLYEVRRMIDLAKNRIRNRRYIPSLVGIPEEGSNRGTGTELDRKMSGISNCSSVYSLEAQRRDSLVLERRDSFSKMAQEPAPEETLTIQELEPPREHTDSPRSNSDSQSDSRTGPESSGDQPSSSSGFEGGGDRSSGEVISGGRVSADSGMDDNDSSSTIKKHSGKATRDKQGDKVTHWLSRLPPPSGMIDNEARHSKLFNYFNARQQMAQNRLNRDDDGNIIRVQVNEDTLSTEEGSPSASIRRYSVPLIDTNSPTSFSHDQWRHRSPDFSKLSPAAAAYFEHQRLLRLHQHHQVTNIDQSKSMTVISNGEEHNSWSGWDQGGYPRTYGSDTVLTSKQPPKFTLYEGPEQNHDQSMNAHNDIPDVDYEGADESDQQTSLHYSSQSNHVIYHKEKPIIQENME